MIIAFQFSRDCYTSLCQPWVCIILARAAQFSHWAAVFVHVACNDTGFERWVTNQITAHQLVPVLAGLSTCTQWFLCRYHQIISYSIDSVLCFYENFQSWRRSSFSGCQRRSCWSLMACPRTSTAVRRQTCQTSLTMSPSTTPTTTTKRSWVRKRQRSSTSSLRKSLDGD